MLFPNRMKSTGSERRRYAEELSGGMQAHAVLKRSIRAGWSGEGLVGGFALRSASRTMPVTREWLGHRLSRRRQQNGVGARLGQREFHREGGLLSGNHFLRLACGFENFGAFGCGPL